MSAVIHSVDADIASLYGRNIDGGGIKQEKSKTPAALFFREG